MKSIFILIPLLFASNANAQDFGSVNSSANVLKVCKFIGGQSSSLDFGEIKADKNRGGLSTQIEFSCTKGVNPEVRVRTRSVESGFGSYPTENIANSSLLNFDKSSAIYYSASAGMLSRSNGFLSPGLILVEATFGGVDNSGNAKPGAYSDEITIEFTP